MTTWTNSDGLRVNFGLDEALKARVGSGTQAGAFKTLEVDIVGTELGTASAFLNGSYTAVIPSGAIIVSAIMTTEVAFTSAGLAALNVGLAQIGGTAIDADGLIAAAAKTTHDAVGESLTGAGALIATALSADAVVVADYDTAAYTAGRGKLVITFLIPDA